MIQPLALAEIIAVFCKEIRSLVRDRNTMMYSVALPLFLYPGCLWIGLQVFAFIKGTDERREVAVALSDEAGGRFQQRLGQKTEAQPIKVSPQDALAAEASLRAGKTDAAVVLQSDAPEAGARASLARIFYRSSVDTSVVAKSRLESRLQTHRSKELEELAEQAKVPLEELRDPVLNEVDVTSLQERSEHLAGLIIPFLSLIMMVLGALYPALETTVGERERGTLETTLVAPTRRASIVAGKYLAVAAFALGSFGFNFASVSFTLYHLQAQLGGRRGLLFEITPRLVLITLLAALLIALLVSSLMMVIGFMVRTFKEGQSYLGPVFALCLAPAALVLGPDVRLGYGLALVPIANLLVILREAISARPLALPALVALVVSVLVVLAALGLATRVLRNEDVVLGQGAPGRSWLRWLPGRRSLPPQEAE